MVKPLGTPTALSRYAGAVADGSEKQMKYVTTIKEREYLIDILDEHHVNLDGETYEVDFTAVGDQPVYSLLVNGQSYDAHVFLDEDTGVGLPTHQVLFLGAMYSAQVEDEREKRLRAAMGGRVTDQEEYHLKAPMPGMVVSVPVSEGQKVETGSVLLILESMKMQNELRAPRPGLIARLRVKPGDRVEQKQTLLSVV
jgi:biotin carboxyl carrier protein